MCARTSFPELSEILRFRVFVTGHLFSIQQIPLAYLLHTATTGVENSAACPLKIETESRGKRTTIRLIGHFQLEHADELSRQVKRYGPKVVLDLRELALADVQVVRLLGASEDAGAKIVNCSQYMREWIDREKQFGDLE